MAATPSDNGGPWRPEMTQPELQEWLRRHVDHGVACPVCTQLAKVYRRKLHSGIAVSLIRFYRAAGTTWAHKPTVLRGVGSSARDEVIARYWGLLEEETEVRRDDGGRAGFWRITGSGRAWILNETRVPKYARIYDGRCLGLTGDLVSVVDALGTKFNYRDLMEGE